MLLLSDMGLFSADTPKRISKEEWQEVMSDVYGKLDEKERIELEKFFRADLYETGVEEGITQAEFDAGLAWLRANPTKHELDAADLEVITKYAAEHLKD
jgi:hypothetical protein